MMTSGLVAGQGIHGILRNTPPDHQLDQLLAPQQVSLRFFDRYNSHINAHRNSM